jgi:hypothetical protein
VSGPIFGTNIHAGGGNTTTNQKIADVMAQRGMKTARMDYFQGGDFGIFRDQVARLNAKGIKVEASLQVSFQWDNSCSQDYAAVQSKAYAQTTTMVQNLGDVVQDFELLNEVSLRAETRAQITPFKGAALATYAGKTCFATLASALKGMSSAIVDQRNATGRPYRVILGAIGNDFALLEYMQQQGVTFDVVGYHIYPTFGNALIASDPWFGTGGALTQLAKFNKPVHINEFNCGEIYTAGYENAVGQPVTNTCLAAIQKHLTALVSQKVINLESIHAYEIADRPSQAVPENRFGLMFDLDNPKLHLALYSAFAGGLVTATEKQQLDSLGLKSQ